MRGCDDCKHRDKEPHTYPCYNCKNSTDESGINQWEPVEFVIETKVRGLESRIKELEAERNNLKSALIAVARGGKYDLAIDNANLRAINRELVDAIRTAWMTRNVEGLEEYANANEQEKSKSDG